MRSGTMGWITGCSRAPGRPVPPICEVSGAGLPYCRLERIVAFRKRDSVSAWGAC